MLAYCMFLIYISEILIEIQAHPFGNVKKCQPFRLGFNGVQRLRVTHTALMSSPAIISASAVRIRAPSGSLGSNTVVFCKLTVSEEPCLGGLWKEKILAWISHYIL